MTHTPPSDALPVRLHLAGAAAEPVRRFVEGTVGWQPVDPGTAELVPPLVAVCDVAAARAGGTTGPGCGRCRADGRHDLPRVVLVCDGDDPLAAASAAVDAEAVLAWPAQRGELAGTAAGLAATARDRSPGTAELRVGGAAGGVGTTTVALALAGLVAWSGYPALVLAHGSVPAPTGDGVAPDDLAGRGTWEAAAPAPGVPGLRVLRLPVPALDEPVDPGPARLVVRDVGVAGEADVLVARRDRAGLAALRATGTAVAVIVEDGPASERAVAAAAAGRRTVRLPWSTRVARVALHGGVPGRLPGAWLQRLAPLVPGPRR